MVALKPRRFNVAPFNGVSKMIKDPPPPHTASLVAREGCPLSDEELAGLLRPVAEMRLAVRVTRWLTRISSWG